MWTSWLERTLAAHDAAEYAARRALRPALGDAERMIAGEAAAPAVPEKTRRHAAADPVMSCG